MSKTSQADSTLPQLIVVAVIQREGRVLLTQRRSGVHLAGYWEFPGGKLEAGESPEAALVRECREECGIEVKVQNILDVSYYRYPEKNVLLLFYDCVWLGGEVQEREVSAYAWVPLEELKSYELPPANRTLVEKLLRTARSQGG